MENSVDNHPTAVILMTYGSATTADHVSEYMAHIYKGIIPEGLIADFEERYRLVGHSPLVEITQEQAPLLEDFLNGNENKQRYIVRAGMLHSQPFIEDVVREFRAAHAERCIGIILSPQFSSFIMNGYRTALTQAAEHAGFKNTNVTIAEPWPTEPHFIELLAKRVEASIRKMESKYENDFSVVFTTHSLPKRVVEKDPAYLDQLQLTISAVIEKLQNPKLDWYAGYQSAGHTPEEWLKPDLTDILEQLRNKNKKAALIVPIQFLADHLEILYDLDIAAKKQCEEYGIAYHRIELPNTDLLFIKTLAELVKKEK